MQWEEIVPVPGHEAFFSAEPAAIYSQAAFLLTLARRWRTHDSSLQDQLRSDNTGLDEVVGIDPDEEDAKALDIPLWAYPALGADLVIARIQWFERRAFDSPRAHVRTRDDTARLARALYDSPNADSALDLIQACLDAPHPLVRVAAAAADLHLDLQAQDLMTDRLSLPPSSIYARDPLGRAAAAGPGATVDHPDHLVAPARLPLPNRTTEVLMRGAGEQDELVRDIAVSALEGARFHFENRTAPLPTAEESTDQDRLSSDQPKTSILIHGTFARWAGWWKPGRVFPKYLRTDVTHNLYTGSRPFYWSGIYSHRARELGARDLAAWASDHALDHVFAHSHGGSVAMLASQRGVKFDKLVLLSCPVHARYVPYFSHVRKVVSIRTHLDLVVLADGGRQHFRDPRVHEHVLPLWFTHSATRQPDVWRRHKIDAML